MNFNELVAAVITETVRPDLGLTTDGGDGRIPQAIQASILKCHTIDFFAKDIAKCQVIFDTSAYIQELETTGLAGYRSLAYLRKNDPTLAIYQQNPTLLPPLNNPLNSVVPVGAAMNFIKIITPDDILDDYGAEKVDVAYQAGIDIYIRSSTSLKYALLGYYKFPNVDYTSNGGSNFDSWVAREFPYAIVFDAASAILQKTGMTDAARKYDNPQNGLATEQIALLQKNNVIAKGY